MRAVLEHVHVNMPWKMLYRYIDLVLGNSINIEIGFAEEVEEVQDALLAQTVERIRQKGCRITAHGPFWDLCPGSIDREIRRVSRSRMDRFFEILEYVRPMQIVCHTGFDPKHHCGQSPAWVEHSLAQWAPLVERAEKLGAPLLLENVWEEDPDLHLELLEKLHSPWCGFCLDTGHQHAFSRTSLMDWLNAVWPYLKEIHLHDNDGTFDHHLPAGMGNIDFDLLFHFLCEKGISPVVTLEPHTEEHLYLSLAGLAKMDSFLQYIRSGLRG